MEVINLVKKTGAGESLKDLKNKSSKNPISPILFSHLFKKQTQVQIEFIGAGKNQFINNENRVSIKYGCIHYPSISHYRISVFITDKRLVNFYPFVSQYSALFFEASGLFVSSLPWLRNKKGAKKKILLYALEARQLVDFHQLQLLNKWHPSMILFLSGSH